ncbi:ATP-binding protein [Tepidicaulis sp. LMO-SS28]|uniref:ATP-binding protein n=1 Tax=Tepidicaulis sp. LMO-SS28 TaxID=3447455 RepID=UPI003EDF16C3
MGQFFKDWQWTVPRRLLLVFTVLAAVIVSATLVSTLTFSQLQGRFGEVTQTVSIAQRIDELGRASQAQISSIRSLLLTGDRKNIERFEEAAARFDVLYGEIRARAPNDALVRELEKLNGIVTRWRSDTARVQIQLMRSPWTADTAKAYEALGHGTAFLEATDRAYEELRRIERETVMTAITGAGTALSFTGLSMLAGAGFALLFATGAWIYITRGIGHPLELITGTMKKLEENGSAADIPLQTRQDEFGGLARGLSSLVTALDERSEKLKLAIEELQHTQRELVEKEKLASLGGLVAGLAHEVNTPLGIARTAASALKETLHLLQAKADGGALTRTDLMDGLVTSRESADLTLNNLGRAGELMRSFKSVAVDQSQSRKRLINLESYIQEIVTSLTPHLRPKKVHVAIECPPDLTLYTDPGALAQVITNFVTNSLKHGFEGREAGHIRITAQTAGEDVRLVYTDNGKGMMPRDHARIFEPFFTTKRGEGSSGLGLHIVYNIVTGALGGQIESGSIPGSGMRFTVTLPIGMNAGTAQSA